MTGLNLYPYQEEGVDWLLNQGSRGLLLGDQPGLGKTIQAAVALDRCRPSDVLVLCPAIMRHKWRDEISKWSGLPCEIITPASTRKPRAKITIASHAVLSLDCPGREVLRQRHWRLIIADEAHVYKEARSERTKIFYRDLVPQAGKVWLLSGTPALNHAAELFLMLSTFIPKSLAAHTHGDPAVPVDYETFVEHYCLWRNTQYGRQITGSKNGQKLRKLLYDTGFMLRRMTKDVLPDLPPVTITHTPLSTDETVDIPPGVEFERLPSAVRGQLAVAKVIPTVHYIMALMDGDPQAKVLVFAVHKAALDGLEHNLGAYCPTRIDGTVSDRKRQEAIKTFQKDPNCRVFLGQIDACGVGIDLTRATNVLIMDPHPSPEKNLQAILRARRIGTQHPVLAEFLALPTAQDTHIQESLAKKAKGLYDIFY